MKEKRWKTVLIVATCMLLLPLAFLEVQAGDILSDFSWSPINTQHENRLMQKYHYRVCNLANCRENKWFIGQNLEDTNKLLYYTTHTPNLKHIIVGSDLGISVWMKRDYTILYMGDTVGDASSVNCQYPKYCNDAIMLLTDDGDPKNGVDARILVDQDDPSKFRPIIIPGINEEGSSLHQGAFGPFNVPTGAADGFTISGDSSNPKLTYQLYLWYATAVETDRSRSFLTCSDEGVEFHACPVPFWHPAIPRPVWYFSKDKFINVSPVTFLSEWWEEIDENGSCALCTLKPHLIQEWYGYSEGMLIFGSGGGPRNDNGVDGGYRESPLYLAYLELQTMRTWFYTGNDWSIFEVLAEPIISYHGNDHPKRYWFGELSVKLIPDDDFEDMHLVMLSNHQMSWDLGGYVYYRTAKLSKPETWTTPMITCAVGYGPYIMDQFTNVKDGNPDRLMLYHTISAWNGNHPERTREPYGIFTTQLRLRTDNHKYAPCGQAPQWPPHP